MSSKRVTLTKVEASTQIGSALVELLDKILEDGAVSPKEIHALRRWLEQVALHVDFKAVSFLLEEIDSILADGEITQEECWALAHSITRVLPPELRRIAKNRVAMVQANTPTERQVAFIQKLGGTLPPNATKQQASELIDELLSERPTIRQQMVLRFWDREDLLSSGVEGVASWMDDFYSANPARREAWELWKRETPGSSGRGLHCLEKVSPGMGKHYLFRARIARVKRFLIKAAILVCVILFIVIYLKFRR